MGNNQLDAQVAVFLHLRGKVNCQTEQVWESGLLGTD